MSRFLIVLLFFTGIMPSTAQVIGETSWESEQDFRDVEEVIAQDILWLEQNPFASESNDTKGISGYVLNWVSNTPYILVNNDNLFTDAIVSNKKYKYGEKFRITYLFGKTYYAIQNQENPVESDATLRGLIGMITVYKQVLKADKKGRHRDLDYYQQLYKNNQLKSYVESQLNSSGI